MGADRAHRKPHATCLRRDHLYTERAAERLHLFGVIAVYRSQMIADLHLLLEQILLIVYRKDDSSIAAMLAEPVSAYDRALRNEQLAPVGRKARDRDDLAFIAIEIVAVYGPKAFFFGKMT